MSRRRSVFFAPLVLSLVLLIAACGGGVFAPGQADRGIGGTGIGIADRGIGGTGIVGTVTAFGSIWINGLRVELPTGAQLRIEGQPASVDDVRIGQVIAVTAAAGGPTGLSARLLDVRYAVAGPVERIAGDTSVILGQTIEIGSALGRDALAPGAWVAVSGLRRPDGVIVAGRIDPWPSARGWLLRGRLEAVTPEMIRVSGLAVGRAALTGADIDALLAADGGKVRIAGARLGQASSVTADPINPFGAAVGALSVETFTDATGAVADGLLEDLTSLGPFAPSSRIVIDSVVRRGGSGGGDARAFGAPGLGGREAPDGDPSARAAGLGRGRESGPPGAGADPGAGPGMGGPVGMRGDLGDREAPAGAASGPPGAGPPGAGPPGAGPPGRGGGQGRGPPGFGGDPRGGRSPGGTSVGGAGLEGRGVH